MADLKVAARFLYTYRNPLPAAGKIVSRGLAEYDGSRTRYRDCDISYIHLGDVHRT
jgi:hypothetical protein